MKKYLTILSILFSVVGVAQTYNGTSFNWNPSQQFPSKGMTATFNGRGIFLDTLSATTMGIGDSSERVATTAFVRQNSGGGGDGSTLPAGAFTTSNTNVGFNPGTNLTAGQILQAVFYGLKPPTATLTGGTTLEYTSASTVSQTLNWSAGRQSNTAILSSIVVAGISQSFSQPAQNASVSGTQAVSVPSNTTTSYNNVVTASDGQTATATTTYSFQPRKYYGFISDTTGITAGTQDAAIKALTSVLSNSKVLNTNTGSPTGSQFYVYAYLTSLGSITSITYNGIPATDAMNTITKSFTTANGYTGNYTIIFTKNAQTTSSDVIYQ